jgi:cytochrome c biogenesis protein CcmG, thiol:disulfide interchange protein DsbE
VRAVRRILPVLAALVVVALVVVGLSQAGGTSSAPAAKAGTFDLKGALTSLRGAPPPLAALHRDASRLLPATTRSFKTRLRALRGHPVVVNKWASWCGPCRHEFPFFQHVGTARGRTVAFVGLDASDSPGDARAFLRQFPLPYPSFADPKSRIANVIGAPSNFPITMFFDRQGRQAFIRQGNYRSQAELQRDIDRYLR